MQFSLSSLPSDAATAASLPTGGVAKPDPTGAAASGGFADLLAGLAPGAQPASPAGVAPSGTADAGVPAPTATLNPALTAGALAMPTPAVLANAAAIAPLVATAVPTATADTDPVVTTGASDDDASTDAPAGSERSSSGDLGIAEALVAAMMQPAATPVPAATITLAVPDKTGTQPVDVGAGEGSSLRGSWTLGARGFGWNRAGDGAARLAQPTGPQSPGATPEFPAASAGGPATTASVPTGATPTEGQASATATPAAGVPVPHPTSKDGFATATAPAPTEPQAPAPAASADAPGQPTDALPVPTSDRLVSSAASGAPSMAPAAMTAMAAEKIAAVDDVRATSGRLSTKGDLKASSVKRVAESGPTIGISAAKPDATMPAGSMPVRTTDSDSTAPAPAVATSAVASHAEQTALAPQLALTNTAHRAVEAVLSAADRFAARDQHSVNLQFSVAGADLNVRVELRAGEVHTTFRTDSPELRAALSAEWQTVTGHSAADRPVRLADPVFASNTQAGTSFSGENSSRQRQSETARSFENSAFARSTPRGDASATTAPAAPAARSVSANSLHLHTLA